MTEKVVPETEEIEEEIDTNKSLELSWVFGMNKDIYNGVHHLGDDKDRKEIFYVAGHIGIVYNFQKHAQHLLQGHTNPISCVCVSEDKRWIVTACAGQENLIVVWDSRKYIPIKTIFNPHPNGTHSIDISHDGMYIVSLSNPYSTDEETDEVIVSDEQYICVWQWTSNRDNALYSSTIKHSEGKPQTVIRFHPNNYKLLVSNSAKRVIFWSWEEQRLKFYSPPLNKTDFRKPVGEFTQSAFIPGTSMAASATKNGEIVLWQQVQSEKKAKQTDKRALKVVQVHKSEINFLATVEGKYIVTGGIDGFVRFFDYQLRLQAWFEEFDAGPIQSVSFERSRTNVLKDDQSGLDEDFDEFDNEIMDQTGNLMKNESHHSKFRTPNFVVATSLALILHVDSNSFNDYEIDSIRGVLLVQGQEGPIQSLAVHPSKPYLAISGLSGHLHLWDYDKKQVLSLTMFQNLFITCIAFDPSGNYLAVGCTNGVIKILDVKKFEEIQSFQPSKEFIRKLSFSHDSKHFAFSDLDNCIGIFKWGYRDDDERKPIEWVYIGRCQAHKFGSNPDSKYRITDFQWGRAPNSNKPRLMSLGEDRRLVEFDLEESCITEGVKVKSVHKIGQHAHPTAFLWTTHPSVTVKYEKESGEFDCFVICNDHYKFLRYVTPDFGRETKCTKTFRCPTFGGPLTNIIMVGEKNQQNKPLMAYSCDEKVVGLILLPLDGNPNKMMGCIAHSGEILDICCSNDGKYLFTAGGVDHTVNQWRVDDTHLKNLATSKKDDINTFIDLVEGGKDGEFYREIKQYFFYAQIRSQGEVTTNERKISGEVPVSGIPAVLRVLGGVEADLGHAYGYQFFSDYEIQNLMNELRSILGYSDPANDNDCLVDFDVFLKVFVNHKPIYYTDVEDIKKSFTTIKKYLMQKSHRSGVAPGVGGSGKVATADLFKLLLTKGEPMSLEELNECLKILLDKKMDVEKFQRKFKGMRALDFSRKFLYFEEDN